MFDIITTLSTTLFRTYIIKKFMSVFFTNEVENSKREKMVYGLFFLSTTGVYFLFHFPPLTIMTNLVMIYVITQLYEGEQKKKILVSFLIYGINMICDVLSVYLFSNYVVGEDYAEIASYITVFLISICEFVIEKYAIKKKKVAFTPPYWNILLLIPVISIGLLLLLIMNNLNNRIILVSVSAGILFINLLIFYIYDVLVAAYIKLEENVLFERQIASYTNQLDVLMKTEEKIKALQHDMKHHLNELLVMADKQNGKEIADYIHNMQAYMDNPHEYVGSGNKEIDSIVNYMLSKAEQDLDKVEHKVNIPKELKLQQFDLNVILGNLLDNAILAASASKQKWLYVALSYEKGMLFINVKNSYENTIIKKGNTFLTTKEKKQDHGIGLQNVKRVVSSYDGTMDIKEDNNIFDVKIMLYVH